MNLEESRVAPVSGGSGLVVRGPGVVALIGNDGDRRRTEALVALCTEYEGGDGLELNHRVETLLLRGDEPLPAFCVVTAAGARLGVLVHGAVEVTVVSRDTHAVIPRQDTATWTTRFVPGGSSVAAYLADASPEPVGELVDLRRGVVPGDGVLLLGDAVVAPAAPEVVAELPAEPPPLPPPVSVPQVIDHDDHYDHHHDDHHGHVDAPEEEPLPPPSSEKAEIVSLMDAPVESRPPLPHRHDTVPPPEATIVTDHADEARVQGVYCSRGHFNDPRAKYCAGCGIGMFQVSAVLAEATRPPLGVLVFENGESHPLSRDLIIGRDPDQHPDVQAERAAGLTPAGDVGSLSRLHAAVRLDGWDVEVWDLGSTNGTFVWDDRDKSWTPLTTGRSVRLAPGVHLAFGQRTAVFETSLRP